MKPKLLNIKDKKTISKTKFCPPHYSPHKLPFGKKITNEPCHIHNKKWRMKHHKFFCKFLKCLHYHSMINKHNEKEK